MKDIFLNHSDKILYSFFETTYMVGVTMIVGGFLSIIFGTILFMIGKKYLYKNNFFYHILSFVLNSIRSIPFLIFVFLLIPVMRFVFNTSFGNNAALLPMILVSVSIYSRFVEQAMLGVSDSIIDRAISMGANKFQIIWYFIFPSIMEDLILSFTSVTISMLSYSTVMGIIGAGGMGEYAFRYGYQEYNYELLYIMAVIFIIYVFIIQCIGYYVARLFKGE